MEHTLLGRSTRVISRIGFGCAAIGGWDYGPADDATSVRAVQAAVDAGVTLFDTADVYGFGHAEEVLGRALGGVSARVTIATKCGVRWDGAGRTARDLSPSYVESAVHASLRRLRVDRIDLLQLHWPDSHTPISETMRMVATLQQRGLVRHAGCCNFPTDLVEEAQRHGRLETQQIPFSLLEREWSECALDCRRRYGMTVMAYNTLAQGLLTAKFPPEASFPNDDLRSRSRLFAPDRAPISQHVIRALRARAAEAGVTPAQEAIGWVLSQPEIDVALVGARSPEQAIENAGARGAPRASHRTRSAARASQA